MVKNKKVGGRLVFMCKPARGERQAASGKDLTPLDGPGVGDPPCAPPEPQVTSQGQRGFPDRVYLLASVVFQNNHLEKPAAQRLVNYSRDRGLPLPKVRDEETQRMAYELAFNTLKYQELLEDIMIDSRFYLTQPMPDDQMSLLAVMLYDFQDRKFLPRQRQGKEEVIQEVRDVENFLLRSKTKLAASFARCRIKNNLLSIECILPESVKKKQRMSANLPLYAWVNTLKCSPDEVQSVLRSAGFSQVQSIGQLEGPTFCQDPHCGDTLVFPAQLKAQLYTTKLLCDHKLILQDKSCSLGPNAACSLLPETGDILMVGCFSGLTVSHMASLIAEKHKATNNSYAPTVYVCLSGCTDAQREELQHTVATTGCNNVKLIQEVFQSLDGGDKRLQKVRAILLIPRCSMSAVSNPVDFILQENGDTDLLQDLSHGSIAQSKLESLVAQQRKDIDHALKFPMVLVVVYSTCSSYPEENVDVVNTALQKVKACSDQEGEPKHLNFKPSTSPFSSSDRGEATEETELFFVLEPSEHSNGCFLAVLNREPEPVLREAPEEVIARANAKGILDRISSNHLTRKEHRGNASRMKKTAQAHSSHPNLSVSVQSKKQQVKDGDNAPPCGHDDFQQSSKEKPRAFRLQAVSSSFPYSKQECPPFFSSKSEKRPSAKLTTPIFNSSSPTCMTLGPACPPSSPVAQTVRPRRAQQEVLKPVVLVLPRIQFPDSVPPQRSRTWFNPNFNRWKSPAQFVSGALSKDSTDKHHPLL
ncbi:putative methyltransferase NSUN7 [Kryptolebias marmoratus]|uniref:NOP2/Sun RNA methyltransferase family member 7 n=1 Tax=Kryptolebias marmoratus TaxID=37003 RepID=A0A3Q3A942_KRYMA|nr:putative methyltransferase NSUN7 [Kryptolebias marmoratus]